MDSTGAAISFIKCIVFIFTNDCVSLPLLVRRLFLSISTIITVATVITTTPDTTHAMTVAPLPVSSLSSSSVEGATLPNGFVVD